MKYNKNIQNKEKIFKNLLKQRLWEYFPPILKNIETEIKGKGKKICNFPYYIFIVYTIFNINWWWIVSIFRR